MLAIEARRQEALELIAGKESELSLAAVNSPSSCVISGVEAAIDACEAAWKEQGKRDQAPRRLPRLPLAADGADAGGVRRGLRRASSSQLPSSRSSPVSAASYSAPSRPPTPPTGSPTSASRCASPTRSRPCWRRHHHRLELGPDPVLCAMAAECLGDGEELTFAPVSAPGTSRGQQRSRRPRRRPRRRRHGRLGGLLRRHGRQASPAPHLSLPAQALLAQPSRAREVTPAALGQTRPLPSLLGGGDRGPEGEGLILSGRISLTEHPWLADHALAGSAILPGTAFLEAALYAGERGGGPHRRGAAPAGAASPRRYPGGDCGSPSQPPRREEGSCSIHSRPEEEGAQWTKHATGTLAEGDPQEPEAAERVAAPGCRRDRARGPPRPPRRGRLRIRRGLPGSRPPPGKTARNSTPRQPCPRRDRATRAS